jgi:hypothetical protein
MSAPKEKPASRKDRRAEARERQKLRRDLQRRARLLPGGAPDRPIAISSPTQVDIRAEVTPCPLCNGGVRLLEHTAETVDGTRLRIARVVCRECGDRRAIYFRL